MQAAWSEAERTKPHAQAPKQQAVAAGAAAVGAHLLQQRPQCRLRDLAQHDCRKSLPEVLQGRGGKLKPERPAALSRLWRSGLSPAIRQPIASTAGSGGRSSVPIQCWRVSQHPQHCPCPWPCTSIAASSSYTVCSATACRPSATCGPQQPVAPAVAASAGPPTPIIPLADPSKPPAAGAALDGQSTPPAARRRRQQRCRRGGGCSSEHGSSHAAAATAGTASRGHHEQAVGQLQVRAGTELPACWCQEGQEAPAG